MIYFWPMFGNVRGNLLSGTPRPNGSSNTRRERALRNLQGRIDEFLLTAPVEADSETRERAAAQRKAVSSELERLRKE